jgi:cell division septation protein DedD
MAENPKQPHALPPLAHKGAARPLTPARPGESAAADAADAAYAADGGDEKRPTGLHTRPDLFGSSAVMPRPAHQLAEESDEAPARQVSEVKANDPRIDPRGEPAGTAAPDVPAAAEPSQRDPATRVGRASQTGTIGTPEASGQRGAEVGVFLPVANLQDHPLRIPESISFEDWPDGPDSEREDGARSPEGASIGTQELETQELETQELEPDEPELVEPEPDEPTPGEPTPGELEPDELAFPDEPAVAAKAPDWTASASEEDPSRPEGLLAWLETEGNVHRFFDNRRLLAAGAASFAALLLVGLVVGVVLLPGDDPETAQSVQILDAPASTEARPAADDLASSSDAGQQDILVAPAGSAIANESPGGTQPDGTTAGGRPDTSQLAALPEPGAPGTLDRNREPIVDFMRIDPDGKAVVAGRAAPGTELIVLDNGQPLGTITADIYGLWTFISQEPLASGRHEIGLRVKRQDSEVSSDSVLVTDGEAPLPLEPEATAGMQDPVTGDPGRQDLRAAEQLAAAAPETPVQSDVSAPETPAEQVGAAAEDRAFEASPEEPAEPAEAPAPATETARPTEQQAGEADQTDGSAAAQTAPAAPAAPAVATTTAPAPAPKPEPPEQIQTAAALPAGGDYVIQLASFLNPETAVREQALVEQRFSDLLAGHEIFVQQVDLAEQGTFYRVRLGPFASLAEARATCARFQERDRDCLAMAR